MRIIFILLFLSHVLNALDYTTTNTIDGKTINLSTVQSLLDEYNPLPTRVKKFAKQFIQNTQLSTILSGARDQEVFYTGSQVERTERQNVIMKLLQEKNVESFSRHSFVIPLNAEWVIKKSHTYISRQNAADTLASIDAGKPTWAPYGHILTKEEWEKFQQLFKGRVYQNISRAMVYLRALEAKTIVHYQGGEDIRIPKTHLLHIPGRPKTLEDRNYVILEQRMGKGIPWYESDRAIDPNTIITMVLMIAYTGWWNMKDSTTVIDGKLYYHDHELPNRHDIRYIFHQDRNHFRHLVRTGWEALENEIMLPYAQKHDIDITELLALKHGLEKIIQQEWRDADL